MEKEKNKAFISRYFNALSGVTKTRQLLEEYVTDEKLIAHIGFYDKVFLNYEIFADEMMAEDNKVIVPRPARSRSIANTFYVCPSEHPYFLLFSKSVSEKSCT